MLRLVKFVSFSLIVIIIGVIAASFLLSHFVDPNQYKDRITTLVAEKSGYQVSLDGEISWSLFPHAGIRVENISLKARADAPTPLITLKEATISMKLLPLIMDKQKQIESISIDGLDIQLRTDQHGNNWQTTLSSNKKGNALTPNNVEVINTLSSTETQKSHADVMIDIKAINIKNANISYENTKNQQFIYVNNLSVSSQHFSSTTKFPITIAFDIDVKEPSINSHIDINTDVMINSQQGISNFSNLSIKGNVTGDALSGKKVPLLLSGDITIDEGKKTTSLSRMMLTLSNMKANATIDYNLRNDEYKGDLAIPAFDINAFRESITKPDETETQTSESVPSMLALDAKIIGNKHYIFLNNVEALLNDIPLTGRVGISSFINNTLDVTLNAAQIEIETLLTSLGETPHFSGLLNFSTRLTTKINIENPLAALNGNGEFQLLNGKLKGENLTQKLCDKVALLNQTTSTKPRDTDTSFDLLKGTFAINNGVLASNDIAASMKGANITSQGSSNLVAQTLTFKAGVIITGDSEDVACSVNEHYQNIALPILCEGNYDTELGKLCHVDENGLADIAKGTVVDRASQKLQEKYGPAVNGIMDKIFGK